ncbi:hypothetical protein [Streptomyces sp. Y7]|uniref:hypothetical protein n=1 Tax=Streptomyces sp. Y7 TaxID=3342392 RepID=UPI00371DB368
MAEQAKVLSVGEMKDITEPRHTAMTVCLLAQVQAAVRDETVVMLSKRMSRHLKRAQEALLEIDRGGGEPRVAPGTAVDVHEVPQVPRRGVSSWGDVTGVPMSMAVCGVRGR